MKKITALFVVMLAFGLNANAQQKKTATAAPAKTQQTETVNKQAALHDAAVKDVATLSDYVKLTADQKAKLKAVFQEKHSVYSQNLSDERKATVSQVVEAQLKSTLTPEQMSKIEGNAQLMKVLTSK